MGNMKVPRTALLFAAALITLFIATNPLMALRFEKTGIKGIYLGLGIGTGTNSHGYLDEVENGDRTSGIYVSQRLGFIINRNILLGIESNLSSFEVDETDWEFRASGLVLTYYPHRSFFIKGGPSFARMSYDFRTSAESFEYYEVSDFGFGFQIAAGADIRLSKHYSILPTLHYMIADFDEFSASTVALAFEFARFW